jgi:hypothetical protein
MSCTEANNLHLHFIVQWHAESLLDHSKAVGFISRSTCSHLVTRPQDRIVICLKVSSLIVSSKSGQVLNQNYVHEELRVVLNVGNTVYRTFRIFFPHVLSRKLNTKI